MTSGSLQGVVSQNLSTAEWLPTTGAAQIVEVEEVVREEVRLVRCEVAAPPVLAGEDDAYLLALGVPPAWLPAVKAVDEDGLMTLLPRLPEEAAEALLQLATGERPVPGAVMPAASAAEALEHPDARRRFWVATDEEALRRALEQPWDLWTIYLHPSQREAVEASFRGPARVSGGAGTGKTVVALHRAAWLAERSSGGRVLLTTFSRTLDVHLAAGLDRLLGPASATRARIDVVHLHRLASDVVERAGLALRPASAVQLEEAIDGALAEAGPGAPEAGFFQAEWEAVIDYWGLADWLAYRDAERRGRGSALPPARRKRVWEAAERVRAALRAQGLGTWSDLADAARGTIERERARPYRHVVVDEAQDFGPRELRLIRALAPPGPRDLFFAGDVGQRIYRWPFAWTSIGVDVRGRSVRLKVNYRTTREIKAFADGLVPDRVVDVDGEGAERKGVSLLSGPPPEVRCAADAAGEAEVLASWLEELRAGGVSGGEVALLARSRAVLEQRAVPLLRRAGLAGRWLGRDDGDEAAVWLGTMHAVKGLEFRAVAVIGCEDRLLPHAKALTAADDAAGRSDALERERQLLYVACTRARDRLLVTCAGRPSRFLREVLDR